MIFVRDLKVLMPIPLRDRASNIYTKLDFLWFQLRTPVVRWLRTEIERRRLFLWLPVTYGLGVAFYFSIDSEPSLWLSLIFALVMGAASLVLRGLCWWRLAALLLAFMFLGFFVAAWRTESVRQPKLGHAQIIPVQGFVRSVDERIQGPRAVIDVLKMGELKPHQHPTHIRVSFRRGTEITPGTTIAMIARLVPPPDPARPGGYDFARDAYFNGIGAVGSVNGKIEHLKGHHADIGYTARLVAWIDLYRNILTRRILEAASGDHQMRDQAAAFVAALITGKRGMLTDDTNEALRAAGIYHVVSIGGFHMTLVAGTIFFLIRALLVLVPGIALRLPVRKIAAVAGIVGASSYCVFSGAGIDTQRALFVTIIVMGAILVDRPALSMRNLALSALICLTFQPETMLGPSFQMSFAGVAALIALFESWSSDPYKKTVMHLQEGGKLIASWDAQQKDFSQRNSFLGSKFYRLAVASLTTTIVAMGATGPFSTYHFQTLNPWGLVGNAFGLPLVEIVVMPLSFIAVLLNPLGLDGPFWYLAGLASVPVLEGSRIIASFEGASVVVHSFGIDALTLMVIGLLWACLWSTPIRWLAVIPATLGIIIAAIPENPDIHIDREGRGAVIRAADGRFLILGRPSSFVAEQWLRADGDSRRIDDPSLYANVICDRQGCVTKDKAGRSVAFALEPNGIWEDCRHADILISRWRVPRHCAARHVIDRKDLDRYGSMAVRLEGDVMTIEGVRDRPPPFRQPKQHDAEQMLAYDEVGRPWQ